MTTTMRKIHLFSQTTLPILNNKLKIIMVMVVTDTTLMQIMFRNVGKILGLKITGLVMNTIWDIMNPSKRIWTCSTT